MLVTALWQDELQKVFALESQSVRSDSSNGSIILFEVTDSDNDIIRFNYYSTVFIVSIGATKVHNHSGETVAYTVP